MVEWFKYGGPPDWVLGKIERELQTDYHDRFKGGIIGYISMIAEAYGRQDEVFLDYPECNFPRPTDAHKMIHVWVKLRHTRH
jgi:hypothetical protein